MHLHHPSLSLNGKKRGKVKFRNAAEAQRARELDASWKELLKAQGIEQEEKKRKRAMSAETLESSGYSLKISADRNTTAHIKSLPFTGGACTVPAPKVYTGTMVKGIATMHKSNAVPVFSDQEAVDISKMRR
jgi:hypothetical protein